MKTRVIKVDADHPDVDAIAEAADVLKRGGLVAFPTETVYGLGANALDPEAVRAIFRAKARPATDPIIVHIADVGGLDRIAGQIPAEAISLSRLWPGPLTLVLNKDSSIPADVTAGLPNVGVRVPRHAVALALLRSAGVPIAAPSANRFSRPSPTAAQHVLADLDGAIDLVLDGGGTPIGVESTVVDLTVTPPRILRPGGISIEAIREILPDIVLGGETANVARPQVAPGQLLRHYAPTAPLTVYQGASPRVTEKIASDARGHVAAGLRVGILAPEEDLLALAPRIAAAAASGRITTTRYGSRRDPSESARELFGALRQLDASGVDIILASAPDPRNIGRAIIDRLTRAAEGRVINCGNSP